MDNIQLGGDVPSVLIGFHPWSSSIHMVTLCLLRAFVREDRLGGNQEPGTCVVDPLRK